MADLRLTRTTRNIDAVVGTSAAASTTIDCGDMAAALVHILGVTASATLTVMGSVDGQTFFPLFDASGAAVTLTVPAEGGSVPVPDAAFPLRVMKLTSSVGLGTAAAVVVSLKS